MSVFNKPVERVPKPESVHPWTKFIKDEHSDKVKRVHNSINNVFYPKPKKRANPRIKSVPLDKRVTFTVVGNRVTKEFIYCARLVQDMHKYRPYKYNAPVVQGCNGVEWAEHITRLKLKYGGALRHCLENQVAVMCNDQFIGGEGELKKMIETEYFINMLAVNYQKESIKQFSNFIRSTGSPCAYLHISIDKKPIGTLIFMLYSSIVPCTCENFLRLCRTTKGGYSGTPVHRIVEDGWIQCGGFGLKSEDMDCENFIVPFDRRGVIGMANDGRHMDCSTQFFVLLQPCPALSFRFVAFGQLIEGEETLKKIEEVETYYEAPKSEITIYNAGIVNLECKKEIAINKNCQQYIENHIDDLIIIGEMFYEMLLMLVFLEAEFRELQRMDEAEGENNFGAEGEDYGGGAFDERRNYLPDNIHATQRFMRKKDEQKKQLYERNQTDRQDRTSSVASRPKTVKSNEDGDKENNDFDVETVSAYEPEEYVYPITPRSMSDGHSKLIKPYYIALTDNPYPGEVDSNFDLKKFLQGNYCLEQDLDENQPKTVLSHKKWAHNEKIKAVSQIITSYEGVTWLVSSSSSSTENSSDLNSDEEQEIRNYLMENSEKASFSGHAVKEIARTYVTTKPIDEIPTYVKFTDEELRRIRMAVKDYNERDNKKVSIGTQPWEVKKEIRRKQTGWGIVQTQEVQYSSSSSSDSNGGGKDRKSSVQIKAQDPKGHVVKRRPTGYVSPADYKKQMQQDEEEEEEMQHFPEHKIHGKGQSDHPSKEHDNRKSGGVWIAPENLNKSETIRRSSMQKDFTKEEHKPRPSVLMRLYDDVAFDERDTPTLKDYKSAAEIAKKKELLPLEDDWESPFFRKHERAVIPHKDDNDIDIPVREHHIKKKPSAKVPVGDGIVIGYFGKDNKKSLQALDFARKRPSITVAQYQSKNKEAEEKMKQEAAASRGIRLPGDSPMYEHLPSDNKLYSHGSMSVVEKAVSKLQGK